VYMKDDAITYPLAQNLIFNQTTIGVNASYNICTNVNATIAYTWNQHTGDVQYVPAIMRGRTNSLSAGISLGF